MSCVNINRAKRTRGGGVKKASSAFNFSHLPNKVSRLAITRETSIEFRPRTTGHGVDIVPVTVGTELWNV